MARSSARVLVVNQHDEVLLLLARLDGGGVGLMTPGGGIEAGETPRVAAARELREETGVDVDPADLHGPLHDGPVPVRDRAGTLRTVHATFYAAAVDDPVVGTGGQTPEEADFLVGHTWLAPDALADDPRLRGPLLPGLASRAVSTVRAGSGEVVAPVERVTARVLPVADGAVLLLQDRDPAVPGHLRWGTIGGAVDPGESLSEAAVRETFEETGIVLDAADLRGPLHEDHREFTYDGRPFLGHSSFFAVALERGSPVTFAHLEPEEVDTVVTHGWWTPADLAADGTAITPDLPDIMRAAVAAVEGDQ